MLKKNTGLEFLDVIANTKVDPKEFAKFKLLLSDDALLAMGVTHEGIEMLRSQASKDLNISNIDC